MNTNWTHNPAHRGAVPYRDRNVAQQFGRPRQAAAREAYRWTANAGRQELTRQGAATFGQKDEAPRIGAAAAAGVAGKAAAKRVGAASDSRPAQHMGSSTSVSRPFAGGLTVS